jgi:hypothetical protein
MKNHLRHSVRALLLRVPTVLLPLIVQRHAIVGVLADKHSFKWEGLQQSSVKLLNHDDQEPQNRQRGRRRRTGGIKGGRQLQSGTTTSTSTTETTATNTTTASSSSAAGTHTPTFAQTVIKSNANDNRAKFKLSKKESSSVQADAVAEGERWCGQGRKNVVVHTVYDSRNIEEAKPNEWMSGLGFPFAVTSLVDGEYSADDDDALYGGTGAGAAQALNGGHWTQTVLAISENIRIGHDELTFYQNTGGNGNDNSNNNITDVMQEHDLSPIINKDQNVAGVITTQFDSTLNVAIVTAGSGLFECAQGNPQVSFQEGSSIVNIVWDLCVCETAAIPQSPPATKDDEEALVEDEEGEVSLDHGEDPLDLEPVLDRNHTTAAAAAPAAPAAKADGVRRN